MVSRNTATEYQFWKLYKGAFQTTFNQSIKSTNWSIDQSINHNSNLPIFD